MNAKQIQFLETLHSSIAQAQESNDKIIQAVEIDGVQDPEVCLQYCEVLQKFISCALVTAWSVQLAFGEGSRVIASEAMTHKKQSEC